jgi:hypothetical protein
MITKCSYLFVALEEADNGDSFDDFMNTMSQRMDKQTKMKLKRKIVELRKVRTMDIKRTDLKPDTVLKCGAPSALRMRT